MVFRLDTQFPAKSEHVFSFARAQDSLPQCRLARRATLLVLLSSHLVASLLTPPAQESSRLRAALADHGQRQLTISSSFHACVCHLSDVVLAACPKGSSTIPLLLLEVPWALSPCCATGRDRASTGRTNVIRSQYIVSTRPTLPSQSERWLDTFFVHMFPILGESSVIC